MRKRNDKTNGRNLRLNYDGISDTKEEVSEVILSEEY